MDWNSNSHKIWCGTLSFCFTQKLFLGLIVHRKTYLFSSVHTIWSWEDAHSQGPTYWKVPSAQAGHIRLEWGVTWPPLICGPNHGQASAACQPASCPHEACVPGLWQVGFLCQLTCQSADIMSSLCGVGVRVRVRVNNFSSKTTRPRDVLFFLKDTLSIEDEKLFKACKSVCSSVC